MNNTGKVRIHGREYRTVALRVSEFRAEYPAKDGWAIVTQIIERNDDTVVMRAAIVKDCVEVATGFAEEQRKASQINQTSALENCETSAIGRCLAAFGLGGSEYASANEVANAIHQQGQSRGHQVRRSFPKPKTNEQQMTEAWRLTEQEPGSSEKIQAVLEELEKNLSRNERAALAFVIISRLKASAPLPQA